jgi:hypothetical protein
VAESHKDGRSGGEETLARRATILVDANDEFNGLGTKGEIANGVGFGAAMDRVASAVALGTDSQRKSRDESQPDGVRRSVLAKVNDLEAIQAKQLGPKLELLVLVHSRYSQSSDWAIAPPGYSMKKWTGVYANQQGWRRAVSLGSQRSGAKGVITASGAFVGGDDRKARRKRGKRGNSSKATG